MGEAALGATRPSPGREVKRMRGLMERGFCFACRALCGVEVVAGVVGTRVVFSVFAFLSCVLIVYFVSLHFLVYSTLLTILRSRLQQVGKRDSK